MSPLERVVFDCNVYFQALISPTGPAGQAFNSVIAGKCFLFSANFAFDELRDVASRPHLAKRFQLTPQRVDLFIESIQEIATVLSHVPRRLRVFA